MNSSDWRPSASIETLQQRAALLCTIRAFFSERQVMEVETPLLARYTVTDPHMDAISADNPVSGSNSSVPVNSPRFYLQTSPEYAMKRLLAAGSGPIYQISKAFRKEEQGSRHNPEFSLLEWYRPGFDHFQLMQEVEALVAKTVGCKKSFERLSYRQVFQRHLSIDPHVISCDELKLIAHKNIDIQMCSDSKDDWLNILLAELIEPKLGVDAPTFIYDYPASQAALAKISNDKENTLVAQRFELFVHGIELANGYYELTDVVEQCVRFQRDQAVRETLDRPVVETDKYLLAAMEAGLPSCAGVALGVDRLLMLALEKQSINAVLTFPVDRA